MRIIAVAALCCAPLLVSAQEQPPKWYDHAVIYEVYPRSFQDSNGDGIGDLKGVTERLDYLQKLGVDAIWLTPFYPSPNRDFGYDVSDFTGVAKEYGTMADWNALVAEAKKRNIRILVDFVVNHTSDQHPWFIESRSSRTNPKANWYVWKDGGPNGAPPTHWTSIFGGYTWTFDKTRQQWYYHVFLPQQPDVNWLDPGLREAMMNVARFWLDHGASGFRLDATPYLVEDPSWPDDPHPPAAGEAAALMPYNSGRPENHEIMRELRKILDSYPNDPVLLGESSTPDIASLLKVYGKHRDEIELPMDFLYGNSNKLSAAHFKQTVDDAEEKLEGQTPVFFFSSHDHERQWSVFGDGAHNEDVAKLTAALTLLQRGTALVYYGEELGMETMLKSELATVPLSGKRPVADQRDGERTPMQWNSGKEAGFTTGTPWLPVEADWKTRNVAVEEAEPNSLLNWYRRLIALRKTPVFRDGAYVPLDSGNPQVFAFGRRLSGGAGAVIVLNMSNAEQEVKLAGMPEGVHFSKVEIANPKDTEMPAGTTFKIGAFSTLALAFE